LSYECPKNLLGKRDVPRSRKKKKKVFDLHPFSGHEHSREDHENEHDSSEYDSTEDESIPEHDSTEDDSLSSAIKFQVYDYFSP
jgi:hypothetical protein